MPAAHIALADNVFEALSALATRDGDEQALARVSALYDDYREQAADARALLRSSLKRAEHRAYRKGIRKARRDERKRRATDVSGDAGSQEEAAALS